MPRVSGIATKTCLPHMSGDSSMVDVVHDKIDPKEDVQIGLGNPQNPNFPSAMECPSGHEATLHKHNGTIPYYACAACQVVYRVSEMK
jgi:hypothetical protein